MNPTHTEFPLDEIIAREFDLDSRYVYLNHAGVAPWPRCAAHAVRQFAIENIRSGPVFYDRWLQVEHDLRQQFRQLLNAPSPADIALVKNTSEALSFVAYGLHWQPGDNIVSTDQEFPSNRIVWESLLQRHGVEFRSATLDMASEQPEEALISRVDKRTRLITVSAVQYGSGFCMDLDYLGSFCHRNGILFCVDAIQSLGAVPFDVERIHADFVAADGHKWMLGPEGIGVFYVRETAREQLEPCEYGWHMIADRGDYDRQDWRPANDAGRFECGSPNMLGIHALQASLAMLLECGIDRINRKIKYLINMLYDEFDDNSEVEIITPQARERRAGIWTFRPRHHAPAAIVGQLRKAGIIVASRWHGVRLSPHFYNTTEQLQQAIAVIRGSL